MRDPGVLFCTTAQLWYNRQVPQNASSLRNKFLRGGRKNIGNEMQRKARASAPRRGGGAAAGRTREKAKDGAAAGTKRTSQTALQHKRKREKTTQHETHTSAGGQLQLTSAAAADNLKPPLTTEERAALTKEVQQLGRQLLRKERKYEQSHKAAAVKWRRASLEGVLIKLAEGLCLRQDTNEGASASSGCLDHFFTTWVQLQGAHDEPLAYEVKFKAVVQTLVEIASQDIHHASVQDLNNSAAKLDKMCKLIEDAIHDHVSTFDMNDEKRTNMAAENRAQIHRYKGKMSWLTKPSGACPSPDYYSGTVPADCLVGIESALNLCKNSYELGLKKPGGDDLHLPQLGAENRKASGTVFGGGAFENFEHVLLAQDCQQRKNNWMLTADVFRAVAAQVKGLRELLSFADSFALGEKLHHATLLRQFQPIPENTPKGNEPQNRDVLPRELRSSGPAQVKNIGSGTVFRMHRDDTEGRQRTQKGKNLDGGRACRTFIFNLSKFACGVDFPHLKGKLNQFNQPGDFITFLSAFWHASFLPRESFGQEIYKLVLFYVPLDIYPTV